LKNGLNAISDVSQVLDLLELLLFPDLSSVEGQGQEVNRNAEYHDPGTEDAKLKNKIYQKIEDQEVLTRGGSGLGPSTKVRLWLWLFTE
jgi:hypothetical protein